MRVCMMMSKRVLFSFKRIPSATECDDEEEVTITVGDKNQTGRRVCL